MLLQRGVKLLRRLRRPFQVVQRDAMRRKLAKELRTRRSALFSDNHDDEAILLRRLVQRHRKKTLRGAAIRIDLAAGPEIGRKLLEKWLRRANPVFCGKACRDGDVPG